MISRNRKWQDYCCILENIANVIKFSSLFFPFLTGERILELHLPAFKWYRAIREIIKIMITFCRPISGCLQCEINWRKFPRHEFNHEVSPSKCKPVVGCFISQVCAKLKQDHHKTQQSIYLEWHMQKRWGQMALFCHFLMAYCVSAFCSLRFVFPQALTRFSIVIGFAFNTFKWLTAKILSYGNESSCLLRLWQVLIRAQFFLFSFESLWSPQNEKSASVFPSFRSLREWLVFCYEEKAFKPFPPQYQFQRK